MTATYITLGCKLNYAETSTFAERLAAAGIARAASGEAADLVLVNTCTVTETADAKCRQAIRRAARENPGARIIVTGCYAQLKPDEAAALPGVALVVPNTQKATLVEQVLGLCPISNEQISNSNCPPAQTPICQATPHLSHLTSNSPFAPAASRGTRTRYWLKVQDGCNYFCTYCAIPFARGRSRNAPIAQLVEQAQDIARQGGKEIVLTGVNIGDFGRTTGETFLALLQALDAVQGIERYRISSLEPDLATDDVLRFVAASRTFMPHFHLPLQSGSDTVLRLMHRRYTADDFRRLVLSIKQLMPQAFIGVDVMVGCRGETEQCFEETYRLLAELPVAQLHVFPYSERQGTAALRIPHTVPEEEKHARTERLLALSRQKLHHFYTQYIGTTAPVLFEHAPQGQPLHGFTPNYVRVKTDDYTLADTIAPVAITADNLAE